jgi:hypothetical protein
MSQQTRAPEGARLRTWKEHQRRRRIELYATREEYEQVKLAASLRHLSMPEYIRQALNAQMRREGVDAVLFEERDDRRSRGVTR